MISEAQIVDHLPLARGIAMKMCRRLPRYIDADEICSVGVMGLLDAAGKFDPSRGVPFGAFAHQRIRGAIQDSLRRLTGHRGNLHIMVPMDDDTPIPVCPRWSALDGVMACEQAERLRLLISGLPQRQREAVEGYYFKHETRAQLAARMGVHRTRIGQLLGQAHRRLRGQLKEIA